MNQQSMLNVTRLPARLNLNQAAEILGLLAYEVSALVSLGLLRPLGRPARNGHKYLWTDEVLELSHDRIWLDKATRALYKHYQSKNQRKHGHEIAS